MTTTAQRPSAERVARRAMVLSLVMYRASLEQFSGQQKYEALQRGLPAWIDCLGLGSELEEEEHDFLLLPLGEADDKLSRDASWRKEGLGVLAWALKRHRLPAYDEQVEPRDAAASVGFTEELLATMDTAAAEALFREAELRPAHEIDRFAAHITVVGWRLREFRLKGLPMNLATYLRAHPNFRETWLNGLSFAEGDLAIGQEPIADVPSEEAGTCESIAVERQVAAYWLQGDESIYSQVDAATLLFVLGDEAKASDQRRALREKHRARATAAYEEGLVHSKKNEHDQAIAKYSEAIEADPNFGPPYFERASAYADTDRHEEAIADFSIVIEIHPQFALAFSGRGNAYAEQGEYPKAIADYTEAIRIEPEHASFYMMRALTYADMDKLDAAIADLDEAVRLEPDNDVAYHWRAKYYRKRGDSAKADADER